MKKYKDIPNCIDSWVDSLTKFNRLVEITTAAQTCTPDLLIAMERKKDTYHKIAWGSRRYSNPRPSGRKR